MHIFHILLNPLKCNDFYQFIAVGQGGNSISCLVCLEAPTSFGSYEYDVAPRPHLLPLTSYLHQKATFKVNVMLCTLISLSLLRLISEIPKSELQIPKSKTPNSKF